MSVDAFLVIPQSAINPPMVGEPITDATFKGSGFQGATAIRLSDVSFGVQSQAAVGTATGGAGAGKATFQPLVVQKAADRSSPSLFSILARGAHLSVVQLYLRRAGALNGSFTLACEFQVVFVTGLNWTLSDQGLVEQATFAYGVFTVVQRSQNADGTLMSPVKAGWSMVTNSAAPADSLVLG